MALWCSLIGCFVPSLSSFFNSSHPHLISFHPSNNSFNYFPSVLTPSSSHSLLSSDAHRYLRQSSPSAAASATAAPSPPARLHSPARGARPRGRPGPGCPRCGRICRRGPPSREWSYHPNSLCAAQPPTTKLHQPTAATAYGDNWSQGVHLHDATVQWVQLFVNCLMICLPQPS